MPVPFLVLLVMPQLLLWLLLVLHFYPPIADCNGISKTDKRRNGTGEIGD
jgi:hypothetical protein